MKKEIDGFILKGAAFDSNDQTILKFFGRTAEKKILVEIDYFQNYFFQAVSAVGEYQAVDGRYAEKIFLKNLAHKKMVKENAEASSIATFELDVKPVERFLMDEGIYGAVKIIGEAEDRGDYLYFKNPKLIPTHYYPDFSVYSFDIETSKDGRVISIAYQYTFKDFSESKVYMISKEAVKSAELKVDVFDNELLMLKGFFKDLKKLDPDILIGWNVVGFDLRYISERCEKLKIDFDLSRDQFKARLYQGLRRDFTIDIPGRVVIDGPWALKMNFFSFESFKLNEVAKVLLGETKDIDEDEVFDKWGEIERRFREDKEALARYNLKDAVLVTQIFKKTNLLDLFINRSIISGMLMEKVGGSTAAFDHFFLPEFHRYKRIAPNVLDVEWDKEAKGGFVLNPEIGIHDAVLVMDFKSLYPTLIRTFFIDPLSRLYPDEQFVQTPTGHKFSRDKHILPYKISSLLEKRAQAKKDKNENLSMAIKILMNSFYGVMGSSGCRFYHSDLPDAITGTGQWILKTTISFLEFKGLKILYGDTDSIFVQMPNLDTIFEDGKKYVTLVNEYLKDLFMQEFQVESHMEIQFDKVFKKLILTSTRGMDEGAKKRYAGLMIKKQGDEIKEEIVMTGMEFVRSDWSLLAKKFQYEIVRRVFYGEDVKEYIELTIKDLEAGKFNDQLVLRKRLTKPIEEYVKNIPPHVKALRLLKEKLGIVKNRAEYVMTSRGAVPIELEHQDIDYDYYIEKQLMPVAQTILVLIGEDFNQFRNKQLSLF